MNNENILTDYPELTADMTSDVKMYGTGMYFNDVPTEIMRTQYMREMMDKERLRKEIGDIDKTDGFVADNSLTDPDSKPMTLEELKAKRLKELEGELDGM